MEVRKPNFHFGMACHAHCHDRWRKVTISLHLVTAVICARIWWLSGDQVQQCACLSHPRFNNVLQCQKVDKHWSSNPKLWLASDPFERTQWHVLLPILNKAQVQTAVVGSTKSEDGKNAWLEYWTQNVEIFFISTYTAPPHVNCFCNHIKCTSALWSHIYLVKNKSHSVVVARWRIWDPSATAKILLLNKWDCLL